MSENDNSIRLQMKYDGQHAQIDANTLLTTLFHFISITKEVNSIVNPQQKLDIKVNAFEKGSFVVDLSFLAVLEQLFISNIHTIETTLNTVSVLFKIKEFLKGKIPQSTKELPEDHNKIQIIDNHGDIYIADKMIFKMYAKNEPINEAIAKTFESLSEDPVISKIEVNQIGKGKLIDIPRENFTDMSKDNEMLVSEENTEIKNNVNVNIIKIVFQPGRRWEFVYSGNKISAIIDDESFFKKIESGTSFAKGDILVVDLEITKVLDYTSGAWLNKNYKILKVSRHIAKLDNKLNNIFEK